MKFQIKNRWTGAVQYECELSAEIADKAYSIQIGWAIKKALADKANLRGSDLSGSNLSGSDLSGSNLRGSDLSGSNLRGSDLSGSDLSGSNLSGSDLSGSNLSGSNLSGSNLSGSNLRGSNLSGSDLSGSDLSGSNLRGSDLSGWIPKIENIHQRVYEAANQPGAFDIDTWHANGFCGTTHCRAGWVVALAGDGGRVLEGCYGTPAAAALIYMTSDATLDRIPDFYAGNADALADMKRLAEAEAALAAAPGESSQPEHQRSA